MTILLLLLSASTTIVIKVYAISKRFGVRAEGPVGSEKDNNIIDETSIPQIRNIDDGSSVTNRAVNHGHAEFNSNYNKIIDLIIQKISNIISNLAMLVEDQML